MKITLTIETPELNLRPSSIASIVIRSINNFAAVWNRKPTNEAEWTTAKAEHCKLLIEN